MAKLIWAEPALAQLDAILSFIALDKPEAAKAVARRLLELTDRISDFAKLGREIPEFRRPDYRQVWAAPCWIYYRIEADRIVVLHVRRAERPFRPEELEPDPGH